MPQEQGKPEVYIITHGKPEGELNRPLPLDPLLANLEKKTFEDLPIKKFLDIGELAKIPFKQNTDSDSDSEYESKSTKDVLESWIEKKKIGTYKKAIVMIDEVPAQSIFQPHSSIKNKWEEMKKKKFRNSGSVPLAFDLSFLSKYQKIQFVIIMTPSNVNLKGDSPEVFEFPQSEYGERKIIEVDGSYHYSELAPGIPNKDIPQSKVGQCLQFYHHLPARYRNCAEIMDFIKLVSKTTFESKLNDNKDKSVDLSKLPPSYPLPDGLKPVMWIQTLEKPDFKDFKVLQSKLQLSKESVTVLGHYESEYEELLKSVLENAEKVSEVYQYLMNKSKGVEQNFLAKDEKFAQWNYSLENKFIGAEDDIVVCVTDYSLDLRAISCARKLLVVITYGENWQEEKREDNLDKLPIMEEAVAKNLVTKFPL